MQYVNALLQEEWNACMSCWVTQGVYITEDGSNHLPVNATIDQRITQHDNSFVN